MARKRRAHGEGGVYQRQSDGKWVASVTTGRTPSGRQRRRVVYGATKVEVLAKLHDLQKQFDAGTLPDPTSLTVAGFLERWMGNAGGGNRGTTRDRRHIYIEQHINPFIGGLRLTESPSGKSAQ